MTEIAVMQETGTGKTGSFRAVSGQLQAMGETAGKALDALTAQLPPEQSLTLVIVRGLQPDEHFTTEQSRRLTGLMNLRREASEGRAAWNDQDETELERLIDAELQAAARRAESLARELGR
jgi:hypothetical protein